MKHPQYWNDVLVSLRQIIRATDIHSKQMVKKSGLTIPQIMVLKAIYELGDVTIKRISAEVSLSQATVTTILNRLEERKIVERVRSCIDKRIVNVRLAQKGSEALADAPSLLHEKFIENFESLAEWEQTQILSSLQRVASMMDAEEIDAAPMLDIANSDKLSAQ
jgi:DNA-binding MarR family transcriptional regulator